jgi:hypothetical protein
MRNNATIQRYGKPTAKSLMKINKDAATKGRKVIKEVRFGSIFVMFLMFLIRQLDAGMANLLALCGVRLFMCPILSPSNLFHAS